MGESLSRIQVSDPAVFIIPDSSLITIGGPGGSGVSQALSSAEEFAAIINPTSGDIPLRGGKYFDILSFDPRGVNNTTPTLKCFPDTSSFDIWRYQEQSDSINHGSISNLWARSKASTAGCSQEGGITQHMNTPAVVADMVEIIERHGEWRSKQAVSWLALEGKYISNRDGREHLFSQNSILERTKWHVGEEQLQYWGFSYGSLLGSTFAAMQPHRAKRMILDGVEDSTDYYSTSWALNLKDTDKIIDKFYSYCSLAGPENCSLNTGDSSPADIRDSVESLVSDIKENPVSVAGSANRSPEVITYGDVMRMIRPSLYKPLANFPQVAELLTDLKGNGSAFAQFKQDSHIPSCPLQGCKEKDLAEPCYPDGATESSAGILCSDGDEIEDPTKEGFKKYADSLYKQSRWLGELWAPILAKCYHWKGKAFWKIDLSQLHARNLPEIG
jgi:pimeloyl-ACP methyl ester carboxylesterase